MKYLVFIFFLLYVAFTKVIKIIKMLTIKEAAEIATKKLEKDIAQSKIRSWIQGGYLVAKKYGGSVYVDPDSLDELLKGK